MMIGSEAGDLDDSRQAAPEWEDGESPNEKKLVPADDPRPSS